MLLPICISRANYGFSNPEIGIFLFLASAGKRVDRNKTFIPFPLLSPAYTSTVTHQTIWTHVATERSPEKKRWKSF